MVSRPPVPSCMRLSDGPMTSAPTRITERTSSSLVLTQRWRRTPHFVPKPSARPVASVIMLSGIPNTTLNISSS